MYEKIWGGREAIFCEQIERKIVYVVYLDLTSEDWKKNLYGMNKKDSGGGQNFFQWLGKKN